MRKPITVIKVNSHLWLFNDNDESTGYLVIGNSKALMIDTMNGYQNISDMIKTLTDLPVLVVNTHGHPDHIYGNIYFEEAYIHFKDQIIGNRYYRNAQFSQIKKEKQRSPAKWKLLYDGDVINLGGLTLEVYHVPGHTPGSIVLLDRKDRILFSGDSILEQEWLQLPESLSVRTYLQSLDKIKTIYGKYDFIYSGHTRREPYPADFFKVHTQAVCDVVESRTEKDIVYEWFGGIAKAHLYGKEPRKICYKDGGFKNERTGNI